MTYWFFHLVFMLPVIGVLFHLNRKAGPSVFPQVRLGFLLIAVVAVVYTTPWDNYLVWRGVWSYTNDRISESLKIGYVPLEEYCFFILQPLLTGMYLLLFARRFQANLAGWTDRKGAGWGCRLRGAVGYVAAAVVGVFALAEGGKWTYAGLILVWACPVLAFQWAYGGDYLCRAGRVFRAALISATAYFWVVDRIAIEWQIWHVEAAYSTGWNLLGLPAEEALFFLTTNLLVIQGLLLFFEFVINRRKAVAG